MLIPAWSQVTGGNTLFSFIKVPGSPQLTALGGVNCSQPGNDIGMAFQQPAALVPAQHGQTQFVFDAYPGGIRNYQVMGGYYQEKWKTMFGVGVRYFDYGTLPQTDASGNILGSFRPNDYAVQLMTSRSYGERWNYGFTLKFLHSAYGPYRAAGIALDAGILYTDTANGWRLGWTAQNMGGALKKFEGTENGELPFDMRIGATKKLKNAPIQFTLTAHHLHQFDLLYPDSMRVAPATGFGKFGERLFRHIVLSTQFFIGDKIEISAGYNYLRRKELNIGNAGNGLNGFSFGIGLLVKKLQFRYARTYLQGRQSTNQIGLNLFFPRKGTRQYY